MAFAESSAVHTNHEFWIFPQVIHHIDRDNLNLHYVWHYFAVTTKHADAVMLRKGGPRMLPVIL